MSFLGVGTVHVVYICACRLSACTIGCQLTVVLIQWALYVCLPFLNVWGAAHRPSLILPLERLALRVVPRLPIGGLALAAAVKGAQTARALVQRLAVGHKFARAARSAQEMGYITTPMV